MITLTSTSTSVSLNSPRTLAVNTTKNIAMLKFAGGTEALMDKGKSGEFIVINGTEITNVDEKMKWINFIMDNKEEVDITGLPGSSLNETYRVSDFSFSRSAGEVNQYDWVLTCERLYDTIYSRVAQTFSPLLYDTIGLNDVISLLEVPTHIIDTITISDSITDISIAYGGLISVNYYVYGTIRISGSPVSGASVYAWDYSLDGTKGEYTTGADGQYQINLNGIAADKNTIYVSAVSDSYSANDSFILDISDPNKLIDLDLSSDFISFNYYVYGTVTDGGSPVSGATVYAQDYTINGTTREYTTGADGNYQINLKDIVRDGDEIKVWGVKDAKEDEDTFTLDFHGPNKNIDLELI